MQFDARTLDDLTDDLVKVRRLREDDLEPMLDALRDPEVSRWVHQIPFPYSEADGRWFLGLAERDWAGVSAAHLAIEHRQCGRFCGVVALNKLDHLYASGWIGYWIDADHRGRGITTAAARLVVRWAFDSVGVERLSLIAEPGNVASQRVAEKCGFEREGIMRSAVKGRNGRHDTVLFGLLPSYL